MKEMKAEAGTLHCPNCGATAEPDAGRCRHCQARLATVSCPSCFALGFDGAAYCHKCGAARVRRQEDDAAAKCPACGNGLQRVDVGATPFLECAKCDGVWVDAEVFERLCAQRESQAAVLARLVAATRRAAARARALPAVPPLRQDDEPRQLREAIRSGDRRLPRARHLPRRRASSIRSSPSSRMADSTARARARSRSSATGEAARPAGAGARRPRATDGHDRDVPASR